MGVWRTVGVFGAAALWALWALGVPAAAESVPALRLEPPAELRVGDHASLRVELALGPGAARPLMLTASAEGEAVEVVRGRLLRGDAQDPDAELLHFEVPLVARSEGRTVVRLWADAYRCEPRCRPVRLEASALLDVRRASQN